jgi:hypothetical protein
MVDEQLPGYDFEQEQERVKQQVRSPDSELEAVDEQQRERHLLQPGVEAGSPERVGSRGTSAAAAAELEATIIAMDNFILNNTDWETKKYYAVACGRSPGLYDSPEEADKQTSKVSGGKKQMFRDVNKAKDYVIQNHRVLSKSKKDNHYGGDDSSTDPVVRFSDEEGEMILYDYGQDQAVLKLEEQLRKQTEQSRKQTIRWSAGALFAFGLGVICGMRFRRR